MYGREGISMGYDIRLVKDGETVRLVAKLQLEGSVFAVGGSDEASLKETYNYSGLFKNALENEKGLFILNGMEAGASIPLLRSARDRLSDENLPPSIEELEEEAERLRQVIKSTEGKKKKSLEEYLAPECLKSVLNRLRYADPTTGRARPSYWDPTEGNAKKALERMLVLAVLAPPGSVWEID